MRSIHPFTTHFAVHALLLLVLLGCVVPTASLNVLITNDDSWGTANIRALYNVFRRDGHNVVLVAPATQQSGTGGTRRPPTTLLTNGAFGLLHAGASAYGFDPDDDRICYVNSTPVSSLAYALQHVCPRFYASPDIVLAGMNQGSNVGLSFLGSGTFGAARFAVEQASIPAIALSAANSDERPYTDLPSSDGEQEGHDQANVYAHMTLTLVQHLERDRIDGRDMLLPFGTLLNVNFPSQPRFNCRTGTSAWTLTRLLPTLDPSPDTCACASDKLRCKLPTESDVLRSGTHGCTNTVSVATPDLHPDASVAQQQAVHDKLSSLLSCL